MREKIQKELESTVTSLKKLEVVKQHNYLGDELDCIEKRAQDDIFKSLQKCDSPGDPGAEQSQLECASVFLHRAEVY